MASTPPAVQKDFSAHPNPTRKASGLKTLLAKILIFLGIPVVISFAVLGIVILQLVKNSTVTLSQDILEAKSLTSASDIDKFFQQYEDIVQQLSKSTFVRDMLEESSKENPMDEHKYFDSIMNTLLATHGSDPSISSVFVTSVNAEHLMDSLGANTRGFKAVERPWFIEMKAKDGLVLTEPYEDVTTKMQVSAVAVPVYAKDSNEIIGAVGIDLALGKLDDTMRSYKLGETGYFVLTTKGGQVLYHPADALIGINAKDADISENVRTALLTQKQGPLTFTEEGVATHGYLALVGDTGWAVTAGLPDSEFFKDYDEIKGFTLIVFSAAVALAGFLIFGLARSIVSPLKKLTTTANQIADGRLDISADVRTRDEVGQMAVAINRTVVQLNRYISYIQEITKVLDTMAHGDMRVRLEQDYAGEFAPIKEALLLISSSLNRTLSLINIASQQVNAGAGQVFAASQALASGAAEQAATVEQLSASITLIAEQASENLEHVRQATDSVREATDTAAEGNHHMQNLQTAMAEIRTSSDQISTITKAIEDIAFQTNILSLNAAVEAARAGSAGKGFAVVADEVRNLAAKSADAAKQTVALIQQSSKAVAQGDKVAGETAVVLQTVAEKAQFVTEAIHQIEIASSEQATAIDQITLGITQVSAVVQTNAATAEESSASSEELAAQAHTLQDEVGKFRLDETASTLIPDASKSFVVSPDEMPQEETQSPTTDNSKY